MESDEMIRKAYRDVELTKSIVLKTVEKIQLPCNPEQERAQAQEQMRNRYNRITGYKGGLFGAAQ